MNVTELLITGFDGDKVVFATTLTADTTRTVLTSPDGATVNSITKCDPIAIACILQLLKTRS